MSVWGWIEAAVAPTAYIRDQLAVAACAANVTALTDPIDSAAADLDASWNPSSFYFSPDDLEQITQQMIVVGSKAYDALSAAAASINATDYPNAQDAFNKVLNRISAVASANEDYIAAVNAARAGNFAAVSAPDLKNWAIETMEATSQAVQYSYLVQCDVPTMVSMLQDLAQAAIMFANAVKALVGIVIEAGQSIYNVAKHAFSFLQWFAKWWPWLAAGGIATAVGVGVWRHRRRNRALFGAGLAASFEDNYEIEE